MYKEFCKFKSPLVFITFMIEKIFLQKLCLAWNNWKIWKWCRICSLRIPEQFCNVTLAIELVSYDWLTWQQVGKGGMWSHEAPPNSGPHLRSSCLRQSPPGLPSLPVSSAPIIFVTPWTIAVWQVIMLKYFRSYLDKGWMHICLLVWCNFSGACYHPVTANYISDAIFPSLFYFYPFSFMFCFFLCIFLTPSGNYLNVPQHTCRRPWPPPAPLLPAAPAPAPCSRSGSLGATGHWWLGHQTGLGHLEAGHWCRLWQERARAGGGPPASQAATQTKAFIKGIFNLDCCNYIVFWVNLLVYHFFTDSKTHCSFSG